MARAGTLHENAYFHEKRQQTQPKTMIRLTIDTDEDNDRYEDETLNTILIAKIYEASPHFFAKKKERKEREKKK